MGSQKLIFVKGNGLRQEAIANAAITPGHLIELMSTGKVKVHATLSAHAVPIFADADFYQGKTIDDAYAAADLVSYRVAERGDWVNALLKNGQNVSIGDKLVSAGDGTLKKAIADSSGVTLEPHVVAYAREAVDMSDSSGADPSPRILIEIA